MAIFNPNMFVAPTKLWMRFGVILGSVMQPLIMSLLFFLMITPLALCLKLLKRDLLYLNYKKRKSGWVIRDKKSINLNKQY